MYDRIKQELTKEPEQLTAKQLGAATNIAMGLTETRKAMYLLFNMLFVILVIDRLAQVLNSNDIFSVIAVCGLGVFGILYILFKVRDYIRGTI